MKRIGVSMASLVDSRPNPPSIPLPQSPPIKTTTNTHLPQAAGSTPSPYLDIPGSFPHDASRPSPRENTSETSRGQTSQLLGARRTSLPSTEREGVKPGEHHDGVGPLPGSISETSVAKLPDERMPTREADQPTQKHAVGAGTTSLPSHERKGVQAYEHHDGVGPLPGTSSETSVAKLPDERAAALSEGHSGAASAGTELQKPANDTVAPAENSAPTPHAAQRILSPETEDQTRNVISQQSPPAQRVPEHVDRGPDVGEDPADSKLKEENAVKEKKSDLEREEEHEPQRATEEGASLKHQQDQTRTTQTSEPESAGSPTRRKGRSGRSSSDSDASHHKKASVMNMVKGEMKVLLGKASRNKGKVEEGEKLKKQGSN